MSLRIPLQDTTFPKGSFCQAQLPAASEGQDSKRVPENEVLKMGGKEGLSSLGILAKCLGR